MKLKFLNYFLLLICLSCMQQKSTDSSKSTSENLSGDKIVIGAVFPMTGPIATYGQESVNGIKLALEKLKGEKIKGKEIHLIVEDNKGEPSESANSVRKLIDIDKVSMIIGSVASSNTLAGAPIAQKAKVPLLTPASTNEKVTKTGDYISRSCFTDDFQGVVMAKFAYQSLQKKNAAIIVDNSSDYSKGLAEVFKREFKNLGGKIINQNFTYTQKDTDFRSLIRKVKRKNPDVIFLPGYYLEVGLILMQARQMKLNVPFLGGDGWDSPKLQQLAGKEGIKNNYISSHFSADDKNPVVQEFVKEYVKKYSQKPGAMAALGYDGMLLTIEALRRAKSLDKKDINDAIVSTKNFSGITGSITIDEHRNAKKSAVVLETTSDGMTFKQRVSP